MVLQLRDDANDLYQGIQNLAIISPHGHCDPMWFAENTAFSDPAELLVVPDHYVFRMLYSQGIALRDLGIGVPPEQRDPRAIFRCFAAQWHLFYGTPSRIWIEYVLRNTLGIDTELGAQTADAVYDQIADRLNGPSYRPRALFDQFGIDVLATTDGALDSLAPHRKIAASDWSGRIIPTFRPDAVLNPADPDFLNNLRQLGVAANSDITSFSGYLDALRQRRAVFKDAGATATDHAIEQVHTVWLANPQELYERILQGRADAADQADFYGHMLIEMAQMSIEDGLVMQLHGGSRRNTNPEILEQFGRDMGADIPISTDWVRGLEPLLSRVGNNPDLRLILFTLDEASYARELAPMAGHWPCLRIGPPWWFHDSAAGIARYFDQVVETAGYFNLAGFNDDTRAFLSIPARHDLWRRAVAEHLARQVQKRLFSKSVATELAQALAVDLARSAYRLT
mgnify:FL=1